LQSGKLKHRIQIHWLPADNKCSPTRSKAHISNSKVVHRNGVFATGFISRLHISLKKLSWVQTQKAPCLAMHKKSGICFKRMETTLRTSLGMHLD